MHIVYYMMHMVSVSLLKQRTILKLKQKNRAMCLFTGPLTDDHKKKTSKNFKIQIRI